MITFHKDGTWTSKTGSRGFWTRHYNERIDGGVKIGDWQGCHDGGKDSPLFRTRNELKRWLLEQEQNETGS